MFIFALKLIELNSNTLYINKIIINLIILARYRFYNKKIIRYLLATLIRINLIKKSFEHLNL